MKFQTFIPDKVVTPDVARATYQKSKNESDDDTQLGLIKGLCLGFEEFETLKSECETCGIGFMSTAFDMDSLEFLDGLGVSLHKIPSGEITNLPYLRAVAGFGKPVLMSTGMANLEEIGAALKALEDAGLPSEKITILHCTTQYPAELPNVNLLATLWMVL